MRRFVAYFYSAAYSAAWKSVLSCVGDPQAKQMEVGAAVHGTFDKFQSMDLPFNRPIAPGQGESREETRYRRIRVLPPINKKKQ
jgi:hypothetical protein